ncbi:MAG TPA: sulfotransferase [Actinomycetota bacterium]|nr:sulfotransferase [Actinomycetota bacterium]
MIRKAVARTVKAGSNLHRPDGRPNVFLYSTPRSGSTWLMELIWSQPGFKTCNQPLYLENPVVRRRSGIRDWDELYGTEVTQKLQRYLGRICAGRIGFTNPSPLRTPYRPISHRIVFKEIHAPADRVNWIRDTFDARVVYLLRHPIAVAISSERWPVLPTFLHGDYRRHFRPEQLTEAERIAAQGTDLERGVLSWCLQNAVALREATPDWAVVTYEQLVLDPEPVIQELCAKLALPSPERMRDRLGVPSVNVRFKSAEETRRLLTEGAAGDRPILVEKWRRKVDRGAESRVMRILELFELDAYRDDDVLPDARLWIPGRPAEAEPVERAGWG